MHLTPKDILDMVEVGLPRREVVVRGTVKRINSYYKLMENDAGIDIDFGDYDPLEYLDAKVEVEGWLTCYVHSLGGIYPRVRVRSIKVVEEGVQINLREQIRELVSMKQERTLIEDLPEKAFPLKVLVLHGRGAQTHLDFKRGFDRTAGSCRDYVSFDFVETGLSDEELASTIESLDGEFDAVFLVRGGGTEHDISRVGGYLSARALVMLGKPFYIAIGHSLDMNLSLLEYVADQSFETPTMAGVALGKAVLRYVKLKEGENLQALLLVERKDKEELMDALKEMQIKLKEGEELQNLLITERREKERILEEMRKKISMVVVENKELTKENLKLQKELSRFKTYTLLLGAVVLVMIVFILLSRA
jgi:exonuclease VII large subunit